MSNANGTLTAGRMVLTRQFRNDDGMGRLRVSHGRPVFEGDHTENVGTNLLFDELEVSGGTTTYNELGYMELTCAASGDKAVDQSFEYAPYQAGTTRLVLISGCLNALGASSTGIFSRMGCYDDAADKTTGDDSTYGDGHFLQLNGGVVSVVERSSVSGSVVDTTVNQSSWNGDVLDGTGDSGLTLDVTDTTVLLIQQIWPAGSVRMGFLIDGVMITAHHFHHTVTTPYIRTPALPVRWEVSNVSGGAVTFTQHAMAACVQAEGGYVPRGLRRHAGYTTSTVSVGSGLTPIMSFRFGVAGTRNLLYFRRISFLTTTGDSPRWVIVYKPATLTGPSWTAITSSNVEVDYAATAYTGGTEVTGGYTVDNSTIETSFADIFTTLPLTSDISGTAGIMTIAAANDLSPGNVDMAVSVDWEEL